MKSPARDAGFCATVATSTKPLRFQSAPKSWSMPQAPVAPPHCRQCPSIVGFGEPPRLIETFGPATEPTPVSEVSQHHPAIAATATKDHVRKFFHAYTTLRTIYASSMLQEDGMHVASAPPYSNASTEIQACSFTILTSQHMSETSVPICILFSSNATDWPTHLSGISVTRYRYQPKILTKPQNVYFQLYWPMPCNRLLALQRWVCGKLPVRLRHVPGQR